MKAFMNEWAKFRIESTEKDRLEFQSPGAPLWWYLEGTGTKLQETHDRNLGQPKPHQRGTQYHKVPCGANSQHKTPDCT